MTFVPKDVLQHSSAAISERSNDMMTIDPRSVKIIHDQKEKEILQGKEGDHIEAYLARLWADLRCRFAHIRQQLHAKITRRYTYEMASYQPCPE